MFLSVAPVDVDVVSLVDRTDSNHKMQRVLRHHEFASVTFSVTSLPTLLSSPYHLTSSVLHTHPQVLNKTPPPVLPYYRATVPRTNLVSATRGTSAIYVLLPTHQARITGQSKHHTPVSPFSSPLTTSRLFFCHVSICEKGVLSARVAQRSELNSKHGHDQEPLRRKPCCGRR